jgi:L-asparaginase II
MPPGGNAVSNPVLVEVTRGPLVESRHRGAIAIAGAHGTIIEQWGDIERPVFPRSSIKMIQALPLVESGAADAFGLSDEHLALACASHSGEDMHVSRTKEWLLRIDASEEELSCGPHWPFHEPSRDRLIREGQKPCRVHNNCSGKHVGFLTLARQLDAPARGYTDTTHPVQLAVIDAIADCTKVETGAWPTGLDGCNAPIFALPLKAWASAMARMASGHGLGPLRRKAARRLIATMTAHPELVSGTGRSCAQFMRACSGGAAVKIGADGFYAAILPALGIGVAIKVDDGAAPAAEALMAACLVRLGALDFESPVAQGFLNAPIVNTAGVVVGHRRVTEELLAR